MNRRRWLGTLTVLALTACAPKENAPASAQVDVVALKNEIQTREREWSAAFLAGNAAGVAALYTEDGAQIQPAGEARVGRAAITAGMQSDFDTLNVTAREDITDEVIAAGDYAIEVGHYSYQATTKVGNRPVSESGRYMVVWRKDADGVWRLHRDIGNVAPQKP